MPLNANAQVWACDCYAHPRMHDEHGVCVNWEKHDGGKPCGRLHASKLPTPEQFNAAWRAGRTTLGDRRAASER